MAETEFLVLRLYGPLAAWGDVAVGEVRPVLSHPTKSALIGLMGAALGIRREENEIISRMAKSYGFAVADEGRKSRIRDFHTVQFAPVSKEKEFEYGYLANRQRELSIPVNGLKTSLTYRDYICDVVYTVAVWVKDASQVPFSLAEVASALREPKFVPYLGRKSCVLSRPMEPQLISAVNPMQAIHQAVFYGDDAKSAYSGKLYVYPFSAGKNERFGQIVYEGEWDFPSVTEEVFRDEPLSRTARQFERRRVKRAGFCRGGC